MIYTLGDVSPVFEGKGHYVADNATIIGDVRLASHSSVWFNAVLRGDNDRISIGANSNVQDAAVLHTDPGFELSVGENVTIGHKVMLHGCTIGDNALIGIGSTILNGAKLGSHCIIGAHSLITENKGFPDGVLILGSPARVVRDLTAEEQAAISKSADVYVANAERYSQGLAALPA